MYIGDDMPDSGSPPASLSGTQLCYTHNTPITVGGETYRFVCSIPGTVLSVVLPGNGREISFCEVRVYGMYVNNALEKNIISRSGSIRR